MKVVVNGSERNLEARTNVADLVAEVAGDDSRRGVAVAVNGEVVPRRRWRDVRLADADRVEVLSAVQGG